MYKKYLSLPIFKNVLILSEGSHLICYQNFRDQLVTSVYSDFIDDLFIKHWWSIYFNESQSVMYFFIAVLFL